MEIFTKTSKGETSLQFLCNKQCDKINSLLFKIEKEFDTDMNKHPELRHEILDLANFIKRFPLYISEVIK